MYDRFASVMATLAVSIFLGFFSAPVKSVPVAFDFEFDVPDFTKPELSPIEQLFLDNAVAGVSGMVAWDTDDAVFVTSNFTLTSNIDTLFDQPPDELVFAPNGKLNQIRSWEVEISGTRFILELTGLDDTDASSNQWFGGRTVPFPGVSVFDLTEAGGGLTLKSVPEPTTLLLVLLGAGLLAMLPGRKYMHPDRLEAWQFSRPIIRIGRL